MDPITVASAVMAALSPYLVKAGETIAGEVGKGALSKGAALFKVLYARWSGDETAKQRLALAGESPEKRGQLESAVAMELARDPAFAESVQKLLADGSKPEVFVELEVGKDSDVLGASIDDLRRGLVNIVIKAGDHSKVKGFEGKTVG